MRRTLRDIINHVIDAPVDCHAFSRLAYTMLHEQHIQAEFFVGEVRPSTVDGAASSNYAWLECFGYIIDFRLNKTLGEDAPVGIFTREEAHANGYIYEGKAEPILPLKPQVIEFMTASPQSIIP